jgi:hypothetical protein
MPPRISDSAAWQQAELLMQPIFIRVVDNIRKLLEVSSWKGSYQDTLIWPIGTTEETKEAVTQLIQQLETATPQQAVGIRETLSRLPVPHPGYHLSLQRQDQIVKVDLWDLCYQVCFVDYSDNDKAVNIDTSLIEATGDVDWLAIDAKAKQLVETLFGSLPD